jgi:hypothetical protein
VAFATSKDPTIESGTPGRRSSTFKSALLLGKDIVSLIKLRVFHHFLTVKAKTYQRP